GWSARVTAGERTRKSGREGGLRWVGARAALGSASASFPGRRIGGFANGADRARRRGIRAVTPPILARRLDGQIARASVFEAAHGADPLQIAVRARIGIRQGARFEMQPQ